MSWLELTLTVEEKFAIPCSEGLERLGALAVSLLDAEDQLLLEPSPGTTPLWKKVKIVGLFAEQTDLSHIITELQIIFPKITYTVQTLADQEWTRSWLDYFQPMQFGEKVWIIPTTQENALSLPTDAIPIYLDPGLAFGTGTHPTTALCLTWLDKHPPVGQAVIDYGCGSGILGIAALKLGAKEVLAVDYDPQALTSTRENAIRNNLNSSLLTAYLPEDFHPTFKAQTILANILAEPLITLAPILAEYCNIDGNIVLSGLLKNQMEAVLKAYEPWFNFVPPQFQEEWVLLNGIRH